LRTPPPSGLGISTRLTGCGLYVPFSSVARIDGQCSRRNPGSAWTVIPSTPGAPLFAFTRFNARFRFSRSHISSISRSQADGLSVSGFAAIGSAPRSTASGASPRPPLSRTRCVFCCSPMSSSPAYSPLFSVWAFRRCRPNMPAADSCTAISNPYGLPSPESRTPGRPPEVIATAFTTHLPDLLSQPLMDIDFVDSCPLV
jgi:hypothetical protein